MVTGQEEKQEVMFDYFDGLLGTDLPRSSTLNLDFFHREVSDALDAPISKTELWETIKTLPADRAPGPNGYTRQILQILVGI